MKTTLPTNAEGAELYSISSLYKAFGYEDVIEVYSRIKDSQMQQVALAQLRVLAEF